MTSHRTSRLIGTAAMAVSALALTGLAGAPAAGATGATPTGATTGPATTGATTSGPTGTTTGTASLQVQAQELAGEIAADGRTLDELDAQYSSAQARYQALQVQQSDLRAAMAKTAMAVITTRNQLKEQAILAYVAGDAPLAQYHPGRAGEDPSLATSYATIVADGEKRAEESYRSTLSVQATQSSELETTSHQVTVTLADIRSDMTAADTTLAAQKQTLSQVSGQLAVAVTSAQQAQQAEVRVQLVDEGQLPPSTPAPAPARSPSTGSPNTGSPNTGSTSAGPTSAGPTNTSRSAPTTEPSARVMADPLPTTSTTRTTSASSTTSTTQAPIPNPVTNSGTSTVTNTAAPGANAAIAYAEAQLGKPYQWGGTGPASFDCSGLVMMAWAHAGVQLPRVAQDQYNATQRVSLASLLPGDLVFFGTPDDVYHVGLYIGNGEMIDAPTTGQNVSIQTIYWGDVFAGGRV